MQQQRYKIIRKLRLIDYGFKHKGVLKTHVCYRQTYVCFFSFITVEHHCVILRYFHFLLKNLARIVAELNYAIT